MEDLEHRLRTETMESQGTQQLSAISPWAGSEVNNYLVLLCEPHAYFTWVTGVTALTVQNN